MSSRYRRRDHGRPRRRLPRRCSRDAEARGGGWLDPDTYLVPGLAGGGARSLPGRRSRRRRAAHPAKPRWRSPRFGRRATMPPRPRKRLLPAQQRRDRGRGAARRRGGAADRDRRLGRAPRRRDAGDLRRRSGPPATPRRTSTRSTRGPGRAAERGRGAAAGTKLQPPARRRGRGRGVRRGLDGTSCCRRSRRSRPRRSSCPPATTPTPPTRSPALTVTEAGYEAVARRARRPLARALGASGRGADARGRLRPRRAPRIRGGHACGASGRPGRHRADPRLYSADPEHGGDRGAPARRPREAPVGETARGTLPAADGRRRASSTCSSSAASPAPGRARRASCSRISATPSSTTCRRRCSRTSSPCAARSRERYRRARARARHPGRRSGAGDRARGRRPRGGWLAARARSSSRPAMRRSSAGSARRATAIRSRRRGAVCRHRSRRSAAASRRRGELADHVIDTTGPVDRAAQGPALRSRAARRGARGAPHRHRDVRLQVRHPARGRPRLRRPLPDEPLLGPRAEAALGPRDEGPRLRLLTADGEPVPRARHRAPRAHRAGLPRRGQGAAPGRARLHGRLSPVDRPGGGACAAAVGEMPDASVSVFHRELER